MKCIAADLIAQAEHDPGKCFLVAWDRGVIDAIISEIEAMLQVRGRADAIVAALDEGVGGRGRVRPVARGRDRRH